jgi:hypothetical protein
MIQPRVVAGALALIFCIAAAGAEPAPPPDNLSHVRQEDQCRTIGGVFYRLAEERRAGIGEAEATRHVADWAAGVNQTGSHFVKRNVAPVAHAARLVFRLKQLNSTALGAVGRHSCRLEFAFENDENKKTAGMYQLVNATAACQQQYPGAELNAGLGECVRGASDDIAGKLRNARVEIH